MNILDRSSAGAWNRVKGTTMGSNPSDHPLLFHGEGFWYNQYFIPGFQIDVHKNSAMEN